MKTKELTELLKKHGMTDEVVIKAVVDELMAENGRDINAAKTDGEAMKTQVETLTTQLGEANKQIAAFKDMKPEEMKAAVEEWKTKAAAAKTEGEKQIAALKFDHALEAALTEAGVMDVTSVKVHLKVDALKVGDDGAIIGLSEQLTPLREKKAFLFKPQEMGPDGKPIKPTPKIVTGGQINQTTPISDLEKAINKGAGLKPKEG